MGKKKSTPKTTSKKEPQPAAVPKVPSINNALIETSWRVALPFMLFSLGGIQLDKSQDSAPLFSLIGVALGLLSVSIVIYRYVEEKFPGTFSGKNGGQKK